MTDAIGRNSSAKLIENKKKKNLPRRRNSAPSGGDVSLRERDRKFSLGKKEKKIRNLRDAGSPRDSRAAILSLIYVYVCISADKQSPLASRCYASATNMREDFNFDTTSACLSRSFVMSYLSLSLFLSFLAFLARRNSENRKAAGPLFLVVFARIFFLRRNTIYCSGALSFSLFICLARLFSSMLRE